ncbi:MAG: monofunctional biosynthetic peptidoglycan transglycosylase [Desulfobacterales bacterium]|nr:MAG: monofunctional biosynthetic peptidoglycan transglycosylase [Desulfobacterales bacterium]
MSKRNLPRPGPKTRRTRKTQTRRRKSLLTVLWQAAGAVLLASILLTLSLRWLAPPASSFMLQQQMDLGDIQYQWVDWNAISPHMPIAVVAAEDQKFPDHWGFDFDAIAEAIEENRKRARLRGASTISQQVAKNLFLWRGRSFVRKGLEAYFTVLVEALWPKRRILEVYLNIAEFGPGIFGVGAASQIYFRKPASQIGRREAALLAAVLPNPRILKVQNPSAYVQKRARAIQKQVDRLGGNHYLQSL